MRILRALYDKKLYQDSLNENFGKPFFSWVIVATITTLAFFGFIAINVMGTIPEIIEDFKEELPYFEINNGTLEIEERFEYSHEIIPLPIIIDNTYTFSSQDFNYIPQYLVATKDSVYIKGEDSDLEQFYYRDIEWLNNTNKDVLINNVNNLISKDILLSFLFQLVVALIVFLLLALVIRFFVVFPLALVGLLISKILKKHLSYGQALNISMYGNILPMIVGTTYWFIFKRNIHWFLSFVLMSLYIGYFIYSIKKDITETNSIGDGIQTSTPTPLEGQTTTANTSIPNQEIQPLQGQPEALEQQQNVEQDINLNPPD